MIGRTLNHYEIIEKLGEGGMGEVYRARDTKLGREIALKVMPEQLATDPERSKRFEREARAVAALKHPNIVTIHSVEEADGVHFITMELVEGQTLSDVIEPGGVPLEKLFDIAVPLADALSAAHAKGIAHRDLKPANIMIDDDGRLKVLDFGLAKLFESDPDSDRTVGADSDTAEGRILGTVSYMSPEQAEGSPIDQRSDVFSLGVVLYELATGERPFKGKNNISTISSILKDKPPSVIELRSTLPRHLGRVVNRCLAKEPDRRYQSAIDVRNELEGLRGEITSGELEVPAGAMQKRSTGKSPAPRLLVGAVVLLAIIVAFVVFLPNRDRVADESEPAAASEEPADLHSIAVLPFANLSGDESNEYFSDGLSEELMNLLAKVPGLRVAARTSSFHFKGKTGDMAEIGQQLNVATILEGSVRRAGDRVRVTAQLVKADNGYHLWSESYDRQLDDIFGIQDDIAGQVVDALKITLLGESAPPPARRRPTDNMEAYDAYLLGQQRLAHRRSDSLQEAATYFQRAIDLDPHFALAWAGLAQAQFHQAAYGSLTQEEAFALSMPPAEKALALDDQLGEAWAIMGLIKSDQGKMDEAEAAFQRAIELNPNDAMANMWYSLLMAGRDIEKRDALLDKTLELDPLSPVANTNRAYWLAEAGKVDEGIRVFRHVIEIDPEFATAYRGMALMYGAYLDRVEEGIGYLQKAVELDPGNLRYRINLGDAFFSTGHADDAIASYKDAIARDPGFADAYMAVANAYKEQGRLVEAVRWARQAIDRDPKDRWHRVGMFTLLLDLDDGEGARRWIERVKAELDDPISVVFMRARLAEYEGKLAESEAFYREIAESFPRWVAWNIAWFEIADGKAMDARERVAPYQKPLLEAGDPVINTTNVRAAIRLCRILQQTGEEELSLSLLRKAETYLTSQTEAVRRNLFPDLLVALYLLQGRKEQALTELEKVVNDGAITQWWRRNSLIRRMLADDPRAAQLFEGIRADVKVMHDELAAAGDLAF